MQRAQFSFQFGVPARALGVTLALLLGVSGLHGRAMAQAAPASDAAPATQAKPASAPASKPGTAAPASVGGLQWSALSPGQQLALRPLAANWNSLNEPRKEKWLAVAKTYPKLSPAEQAKLHAQMTDWATLSMQQRDQARLNYAQAKAISPDERQDKWRKYQELTPEQRRALANSAPPVQKGAAPAIKPGAEQKITVVPPKRRQGVSSPNNAGSGVELDRNTLLPRTPKSPASRASAAMAVKPPAAPSSAQ